MPAITLWNRLEPRPHTEDLASTLAARVRDPVWFLTRQWQVGELHGEDCGSPAYAAVATAAGALARWTVGEVTAAIPAGGLLERELEAEPITPDLLTRVELGRLVEELAAARGFASILPALRAAFPLPPAPPDAADPEVERVRAACAGRVVDGVDFLAAAVAASGWPPSAPAAPDPGLAASLIAELRDWVADVWGAIGGGPPATWDRERLEYAAQVDAIAPGGAEARFAVHADPRGDFDWYSFDLERVERIAGAPGERFEVMPARARFRGMANARWWEIEPSVMDFGAIRADRPDLAKLVVIDFMVIAANDWYVIPLELPVGSLCAVTELVVHDVFGVASPVARAVPDTGTPPTERWSMFTTSAPDGIAPYYLLPATAAAAAQDGPVLEDVRLFRDEMANMVWAVEHVIEDELGAPRPGLERTLARRPASPARPASPETPLSYLLQTDVPEHWIPFVPVLIDPVLGDVALERAAMLRPLGGGGSEPIVPAGRILEPSVAPYRLREEEVPREGVRVIRRFRRCRGVDGSTRLWQSRMVVAGRGEGASGLRFDVAARDPGSG